MKTYPVLHDDVGECGGVVSRILNLTTRWRWVVNFMPRQLYSRRMSPWYPLGRRLGGPQSRCRCGTEKDSFPCPAGNRSPVG